MTAETLNPTGTSSSDRPSASVTVAVRRVTSPVRTAFRSGVRSILAAGFGSTSMRNSAAALPAVAVTVTLPGAPSASTPRVPAPSVAGG